MAGPNYGPEPADKMTVDSSVVAASPARARKSKSYGKVALAALFWSSFRSIIYTIVALPTTVILARLLSPADFGIAAAATFFSQLAARVSAAGMGAALIRVKDLREDHLSSVFVFNAAINLAAFAILALSAPAIGAFYGNAQVAAVLPFVALNFVIGSLFTVQQALLAREMRYRELAIGGTFELFASSVSSCVLAWWGYGYWSLILGGPIGEIAKGAVSSYYARWRPKLRFSREAFGELFSFGAGSYASSILGQVAMNADNIVIGRVLGITALGFYDKGFSAGNRLFRKLTAIGPSVSFRIFSIIQDDPERFRRAYRKIILSSTLIGYPTFAVLIAIAHPLFAVVFGRKWLPSVVPFQIICVAFMLKLSSVYVGAAAQARGWIWSQVWRQVVSVTLITIGAYALSPWGINGAAAGVLAATIVVWVLMQQLLRSATHLGWRDIVQPQIPAMACSVGLVALLEGVEAALVHFEPRLDGWIILGAQSAIGVLAYLGFLKFSGFHEVSSLVGDTLTSISPKLARFLRVPA